jgi:hypothetical protein
MDDVKRCTRCILPVNYPEISFDEKGVCSYCHAYDEAIKEFKEKDKNELVKQIKKGKGKAKYSLILGLSGGKDSCYALHKIVKDLKITDILAVTVDNGHFSEDAKKNIDLLVSKLNIDHKYVSLDKTLREKLYQTFIKKQSSDFCLICQSAGVSFLFEEAVKQKIKFVVQGLSIKTDALYPSELVNIIDYRYAKDIFSPEIPKKIINQSFKYTKLVNAFNVLFIKRVKLINLPEYYNWNIPEIKKELEIEYGWVDYGEGRAHFDCLAFPLAEYFSNQKFNVGKSEEAISVLVRDGQLSRDEGLIKYHKEKVVTEPVDSMEYICKNYNIDRESLLPYINGTTKNFTAFKSNVKLLRKISFVFWIFYKLNLISKAFYMKYS